MLGKERRKVMGREGKRCERKGHKKRDVKGMGGKWWEGGESEERKG